jgi:hypothetical protein
MYNGVEIMKSMLIRVNTIERTQKDASSSIVDVIMLVNKRAYILKITRKELPVVVP